MALEHTNLTILNPYLLYFSKDGGVDSIVDQWNMELPRERVLELLEYCERYLKNYPTNDHIEFENMKKRGRMDEFERIRLEKEATTKPNKEKREIYLIKDVGRGLVKIGVAKNTRIRFSQLKTANAGIELIKFYHGISIDERLLHKHFKTIGKRVDGEWFSLSCEDLDFIDSYFSIRYYDKH